MNKQLNNLKMGEKCYRPHNFAIIYWAKKCKTTKDKKSPHTTKIKVFSSISCDPARIESSDVAALIVAKTKSQSRDVVAVGDKTCTNRKIALQNISPLIYKKFFLEKLFSLCSRLY
jgi:hypothetical protein